MRKLHAMCHVGVVCHWCKFVMRFESSPSSLLRLSSLMPALTNHQCHWAWVQQHETVDLRVYKDEQKQQKQRLRAQRSLWEEEQLQVLLLCQVQQTLTLMCMHYQRVVV